VRVRKKSDKRREKRRLKPVEWASPTRQQLHSSGILRRNISSQSWVNVHFYFKSWIILSYFQLLIWQVNNFQIVYCIVNYGVLLLPGVVSSMSTTREFCIKGKRKTTEVNQVSICVSSCCIVDVDYERILYKRKEKDNRSQSSEHLRPVKNCILRRINRSQSQSRVNILYFYVEI
jgi:hypothetical protein